MLGAGLVSLVVTMGVVSALASTNYRISEPSVGGIGTAKTSSPGYQALTSGGIIGFGNSTGTLTQINAGHETTDEPALSFAVASSSVNFGSFSATTTATTTSTFAVLDYTSYGYVVQVLGNAPSNGVHTIDSMASTGPSTVGVEQFGINLVANTSPSSFGANPDHGQFGFGSASANYGTSNNYRYVSGETVVTGPKSSGVTVYTMSYIINVSSLTQGGIYSADQTILCTATF
ncbi:MAG: exported protein of unknown function [Candidatus Saccharibacteria bacterium]|nr:exported protein of unknown function [Candidatus Saccharibacteria bacterium]